MKKLAFLTIAAAALFAMAGGASAQYYSGPPAPPGYGPPQPRYERDYYDERRYRRDQRRHPRRNASGCPQGYTVQDGVCKPYRGY